MTSSQRAVQPFDARLALRHLLVVAAALVLVAGTAESQLRLSAPTTVFTDDDGLISLNEWTKVAVGPRNMAFMVDLKREGLYVVERPGAAAIRIGRKGGGPGEYQNLAGFGWLGDTLWLSDDGTRRLTFIEQLGRGRVHTQAFVGAVTQNAIMMSPVALTPEGGAITYLMSTKRTTNFELATFEPLARITRTGVGAWDTLMLLDPRHRMYNFPLGSGRWSGAQPMSDATLWALSRNGKYAVKVDRADDAPFISGTTVTLISTRGSTGYRQRFARSSDAVSDADVDAVVQRSVDVLKRPGKPRDMPELPVAPFRKSLYRPRYRVSFTEAIVGDDGTVLLRGNDWSSTTVPYSWITPNGSVRGTFTVPVSQYVRAVVGDDVWSVMVDADGAGTLVQQRVR